MVMVKDIIIMDHYYTMDNGKIINLMEKEKNIIMVHYYMMENGKII